MRSAGSRRRYRFIEVIEDTDAVTVSFTRCLVEEPGLRWRIPEIERVVVGELESLLAHPSRLADGLAHVTLSIPLDVWLHERLRKLDRRLGIIAARPLTPRLVQLALGISGKERVRWTKDGRLKSLGSSYLRGTHLVRFDTYASQYIARLARNPGIIAGWRIDDSKSRRLH